MTKRIISLLLSLLVLLPLLCIAPLAEDENSFIFVNGENITRYSDTVVIYRNVGSTGQTQWGHNIIVDADGIVTDIVEAGLPEAEDLTVPEGCTVISASGTKSQWFKTNVQVGTRLYYDSYTQRIFLCDANGNFDPYFEKSYDLTGDTSYIISDPLAEKSPLYTYDIAVSKDGFITARGSNIVAEEGGYTVSAATESSMRELIMHSPLGAKCVIKDGVLTITYDKNCFKRTLEYELNYSKSLVDGALAEYYNIDAEAFNAVLAEVYTNLQSLNYRLLVSLTERLKTAVNSQCVSTPFAEARAAYHTPTETDINAVRATVKRARSAGLNTLLLRITNGYGTCVPMPEGSKFTQDSIFGGFDVLKAYITVCAEENITLGLAIDVYYNKYASIAAPDWMTKANGSGKGLADKYFSPQNKEFKEFFIGYIEHIVSNYDIKLITLEYLRYPKYRSDCDLGYDSATLNEFSDKYGVPIGEASKIGDKAFDSPYWEKWVEYKTSLVSDMAKSISETVRTARGDVTLLATAGRDSVTHYYMQDAIGWINEGLFDGLILSLCESDVDEKDITELLPYSDGFVKSKSELFAAYTAKEKYFLTALESEKAFPAEVFAQAVTDTRSVSADGFIASSLDAYIAQGYAEYLSDTLFKEGSAPILSINEETASTILEYAKTKINGYILTLGGSDADTAAKALSKINNALLLLEQRMLSYEEAKTLESDIAMLYSASEAKRAVLTEFEALTKLCLLKKESTVTPPENDTDPDISEPEASTPEISDAPTEESTEISKEASEAIGESGVSIEFSDILVYLFVGFAFIVAVVAIVIGIKRKNTRPKNAHMPKASQRDKKEQE